MVFTGFLLTGVISANLFFINEVLKAPYKLDEKMVIIIVACMLIALYLGKLLLWNLRGKENIKVKDNILIIRKKGTI